MSTQTVADAEQVVFDALEMFGIERDEMVREATLEDLDLDSVDLLELGAVVGERCGIRLETTEFKDLRTLGEALDVITSKL